MEVFVGRMSPQQFWLLLVLILFTSFAGSVESHANDGVGMVTSFMTQLGTLLEREDLRSLLLENQPTNQKRLQDEQEKKIWKNIDDNDYEDEGVLLRTLTAHIPCRWLDTFDSFLCQLLIGENYWLP